MIEAMRRGMPVGNQRGTRNAERGISVKEKEAELGGRDLPKWQVAPRAAPLGAKNAAATRSKDRGAIGCLESQTH